MARNSADENRVHPKSTENEAEQEAEGGGEEEEEEEALSLCDLPIKNEIENQREKQQNPSIKTEEDFDFGPWGGAFVLAEPAEMCAADDLFFQGQIMPLRHSVSSESSLAMLSRNPSRCISRSESMDRFHVAGSTTVSSRSSSIRSQHSSSSGSSSTAITTATTATSHRRKVRNQFHSHPSPSPQIRIPSTRYVDFRPAGRKSTMWSFFRVGLVQTPEIELQGLKIQSKSSYHKKTTLGLGSRCSSRSSSSSDKKKKHGFFDYDGGLFGGGCKCSVDAEETVPLRNIDIVKGKNGNANEDREEKTTKKKKKQAASRHRTFEWLKELSNYAGDPDEA